MTKHSAFEEEVLSHESKYDSGALDEIWATRGPSLTTEEKTILIDAYMSIYGQMYYDLACDKLEGDEISICLWLIEMLDQVRAIDPQYHLGELKGELLESIAHYETDVAKKYVFLDRAIAEYFGQSQMTFSEKKSHIAYAELTKLQLDGNFPEEKVKEIIAHSCYVLESSEAREILTLVGVAIQLFELIPEPDHKMFWHTIESAASFAKKSPKGTIEWVRFLNRRLRDNKTDLSSADWQRLADNFLTLMAPYRNCAVTDLSFACEVGLVLKDVAVLLVAQNYRQDDAISLYESCLKIYHEAQSLNPDAWTYVNYAADAASSKAQIYLSKGNILKAHQSYIEGLGFYERSGDYLSTHFGVTISWARYLIEMYKNLESERTEKVLDRANEKFQSAKISGEGFHSSPYYGIARVALLKGDKAQALSILKECRDHFLKNHAFDFDTVKDDEDFIPIWNEMQKL